MNLPAADTPGNPDLRPWFREPWVWLLIALPAIAIIGCAITIWLALSRPDHLVVDKQQYQQLETGFRAGVADQATAAASQDPAAAGQDQGVAGQDKDAADQAPPAADQKNGDG